MQPLEDSKTLLFGVDQHQSRLALHLIANNPKKSQIK
jgi:hypothetical protein